MKSTIDPKGDGKRRVTYGKLLFVIVTLSKTTPFIYYLDIGHLLDNRKMQQWWDLVDKYENGRTVTDKIST